MNGGLSNVLTIARKELKVYFVSPLFYVVTALFVLATLPDDEGGLRVVGRMGSFAQAAARASLPP